MTRREGDKRKVRSDKKHAIAPYIADEQRVWISRISHYCNLPEGEVGVRLISNALLDESCMVFFSSYFRRDFRFTTNITYCGHHNSRSIYSYIVSTGERSRYKIKASQTLYNQLCEFQISLGIHYLAHATYALLQYALHDLKTVRVICPGISREDFIGPAQPVALMGKGASVWSIFKKGGDL